MGAAAVAAPPETGISASADADLGSILTDAYESVTAEPQAPVEAAAEPTPGGEAPTSPETPATPMPETPGGEGPTSEFALSEDGNAYLVPKDQLPVYNGYKQYASEVQTIFPTANDARTAQQDSSDLRAMTNDFVHGSEADVDAFLRHFAGEDYKNDPATYAQYQQAFTRMAPRALEVLKTMNPQAHEQVVGNFVNAQIESAYDRAKEFQDEATASGFPGDQRYADVMLQRAQQMEWGATGKVRGTYDEATGTYKYDFQKAQPQTANQLSPEAQQLAQREAQLYDRDYKYFDQTELHGPMWKDYFSDIDRALAPVKDKYSEIAFQDMREGINKQLLADLNKDREWARMNEIERNAIQAAYKHLWKNNQPIATLKPRIAAYRADVLARARQLLPAIAKARINSATASAVAQNKKAPTTARPQTKPTQASPAAPANNGRRVPYSIHEDPEFNDLFKLPAH